MLGWRAVYADDSTQSGPDTTGYKEMGRDGLVAFQLVNDDGAVVFETRPPQYADARHLRYRIASELEISADGSRVTQRVIRVGWSPMGPAFVLSHVGSIIAVCDRWHDCDVDYCDHPMQGWFYEPQPVGGER